MQKIKLFLSVAAALVFAGQIAAQNKVTGIVTDMTNEPVPGAAVLVSGKNAGTSTNENGEFSVAAAPSDTLIVDIIGYVSQRIPVDGRSTILVKLADDTQQIEATVVIGYGSAQKIGNIVGSVKTVSAGDIVERPSANIGDALQGKVAGLQIFNTSGEPNSNVSVRLRGESSLSLSNEPMYIMDGVPVSSSVFSSINPQDIENISILKDASSTAIYGSRAANGVIFITTKQGKKGEKPTLAVRAQYGVSMLTNYNMDMMNSKELIQFEEMCQPSLKNDVAYQARKAFILGNNLNYDWTSYLFDDAAPMLQADASLRGATENTNYYVSLGYYSENGTFKVNSGTDRFNFRTNIDTKIAKWAKFGANLAISYSKSKTTTTGWYKQTPIVQALTNLPYRTPYEILYNEDGTISYGDRYETYPWDQMPDLIEYYNKNTNDRQNVNITGQTYILLTPFKGLNIRARQSVDGFDYTGEAIYKPSYTPGTNRGTNVQGFQRYYQLISTNTAEYKTAFKGGHNLTLLLGHESILKHQKTLSATGTGLTDDRLTQFGSTTTVTSWDGGDSECTFNSFFFNVNYDFNDKYFLDASVRTDGSSLFGANHRYATFYSVGAMWKMKNESWLQNVSWLDDLNLNVSYGTTGNSGLGSWYASYGLVSSGATYNGQDGWGITQVKNPDLTWETVGTLNVRLAGRVFDRVSFDLQYYDKSSWNLLMSVPFSATTGHGSGFDNIAAMNNHGFDLELDIDLIHTRNFYWGISGNVNYNKNEITKLYRNLDELSFPLKSLKYQVGKPSSLIFTQIRAGVDPRDGAPMWYDLNGNLTKTYSDDIMQFWEGHDTNSPWSGGFSTNLSWNGFGLNADFSWIGERWIFIDERYYTMNATDMLLRSNFEKKMLDIWTTPGQVTDIPKYGTPYRHDSSRFSNASFIRLKNLSLSYSLPKKWLEKTKAISNAKIYLTGRNLLTITDFEGYDPEVGYGNATSGMYPNSRQFVIGAEIVF